MHAVRLLFHVLLRSTSSSRFFKLLKKKLPKLQKLQNKQERKLLYKE